MLSLARVRGKYWDYVQKLILTYVFKSICVCVYMHVYLCLTGGLGVSNCMSLAGQDQVSEFDKLM